MAQTRKIIQLLTNDCHKLIALCNDGTVLIESAFSDDAYGWVVQDWSVPQPTKQVKGKQVKIAPPSNISIVFDSLWQHWRKCKQNFNSPSFGGRQEAYDQLVKLSLEGESPATADEAISCVTMLMDDMKNQMKVDSTYEKLHLRTYLSQKRWIQ